MPPLTRRPRYPSFRITRCIYLRMMHYICVWRNLNKIKIKIGNHVFWLSIDISTLDLGPFLKVTVKIMYISNISENRDESYSQNSQNSMLL